MRRDTFLSLVSFVLLLWGCFLFHSCTAGQTTSLVPVESEITRAPSVLVGVGEQRREEARFAVRGPCRIGSVDLPSGIEGKIAPTADGLDIAGHRFPMDKVRVDVERSGDLRVEVLHQRRNKLYWRQYHGDLVVLRDRGKVTLANEVDVENYLAGVLGGEMNLSRGREALKAQVIAARTYAMCEVKNGRLRKIQGELFDLYDDERSQVYMGMEVEAPVSLSLIGETRGMFLVWNEQLVNTFYSSTCGGHTDAAWEVLGEGSKIEPLSGTECGYCESSPHYKWEAKFTRREMAEKLFPDEPNLRVDSAEVVKRLAGGHGVTVAVNLVGHKKPRMLHANTEFRRRLRYQTVDGKKVMGVKSSLIDEITAEKDTVVVRGRGWGHGAGMCQYGAYGMAAAGRSAKEILEHYFPGAAVKKLY